MLNNCLKAIRLESLSVTDASEQFQIPRRTLFHYLIPPVTSEIKKKKCGHPMVFLQQEEDSFAQHLLVLAEFGMSLSKNDLKVCVRNYLEADRRQISMFRNNMPGKYWTSLFLARHPILSARIAENVKVVLFVLASQSQRI